VVALVSQAVFVTFKQIAKAQRVKQIQRYMQLDIPYPL
jgi:hypothetical protein